MNDIGEAILQSLRFGLDLSGRVGGFMIRWHFHQRNKALANLTHLRLENERAQEMSIARRAVESPRQASVVVKPQYRK